MRMIKMGTANSVTTKVKKETTASHDINPWCACSHPRMASTLIIGQPLGKGEIQMDISAHVVESLKLDHDRKLERIRASVPRLLLKPFQEYAGLKDSKIYTKLCTGEVKYLALVMEKT